MLHWLYWLYWLFFALVRVYRAKNPKKSPLWQCGHRRYNEVEVIYPAAGHGALPC